MSSAPSPVAERAKALLDKKAARDLPDAKRIRGAAEKRGESNADAFFSALVEGAFLLAAADGELSDDEAATLGETIAFVTGEALEPDEFMGMIDAFADALDQSDLASRLTAVARAVPDVAARREVLGFATLIALCDRDLADAERAALGQMAKAFGLAESDVDSLVADVQKALGLRAHALRPSGARATAASLRSGSRCPIGTGSKRVSAVTRASGARAASSSASSAPATSVRSPGSSPRATITSAGMGPTVATMRRRCSGPGTRNCAFSAFSSCAKTAAASTAPRRSSSIDAWCVPPNRSSRNIERGSSPFDSRYNRGTRYPAALVGETHAMLRPARSRVRLMPDVRFATIAP